MENMRIRIEFVSLSWNIYTSVDENKKRKNFFAKQWNFVKYIIF